MQLQLEGVVCKSEGGLSPDLEFGSAVDIPDSKNVKNKCLVFYQPSRLWYFFYSGLNRLRQSQKGRQEREINKQQNKQTKKLTEINEQNSSSNLSLVIITVNILD